MNRRTTRGLGWLAVVWTGTALPGCLPLDVDPLRAAICGTLNRPIDVQAVVNLGPPHPLPPSADAPTRDDTKPPPKDKGPLRIPDVLPGANEPPLRLPPLPKDAAGREKILSKFYPALDPIGPEIRPLPGPDGRPMTLADLQKLATARSPVLRRATAAVQAARGAAIQARLHPNPTIGYECDQVQPGSGPTNNVGQQGFYINQLIKTGGKLNLAAAAAEMDVVNAEVALRQAHVELTAKVRAGYFAVLVAEESLRFTRSLSQLADDAYCIQLNQVLAALTAGYEPLQLYVYALQARQALVQARNRYVSAWKQLTAQMGVPDMHFTALAGRADSLIPQFHYPTALEQMLGVHTLLRTAENTVLKAKYNLRLAEVMRLPDLQTNFVYQHDNASGNNQFNLQLGISPPLWDRNQGNIQFAKGLLAQAVADLDATRNDLIQRLAEAFERYENYRILVTDYRERILKTQVRVYRAIRDRYQLDPEKVSFADLITAQQNIANVFNTYLGLLGNQWTAVVDVAALLQLDELYLPGQDGCLVPGSPPGVLETLPLPQEQVELLPRALMAAPVATSEDAAR